LGVNPNDPAFSQKQNKLGLTAGPHWHTKAGEYRLPAGVVAGVGRARSRVVSCSSTWHELQLPLPLTGETAISSAVSV